MDLVRNRVKAALDALNGLRYADRRAVTDLWISDGDYRLTEKFHREEMSWRKYGRDETWGGRDRHFWFCTEVAPGEDLEGREVRAVLNTGADDIWNTDNPQIMAYVDGVLAGTLDLNHQDLILTSCCQKGRRFELAFYAYSNSQGKTNFFHLDLAAYEEAAARLYYDLKVPFEASDLLPEENLERIQTLRALNSCVNLLDFRRPGSEDFIKSVEEADEFLRKNYYNNRKENPITVHSIGHTHIDVAWKWPLRQTRQKAVRSFRTVLGLMERYPEYKFMSSQPQLYQFVKEEAPEVYEQIKERVAQGRWEAEGAMWLEPDCNLASGESLIRHILYGRRFFEKELKAAPNEVLWLPDVFGYSAALPQIMKKSGLSYFMTTKLGWNEYNQFPYDTFLWKGIDGSQVLTYLITTRDYRTEEEKKKNNPFSTTYNGRQDARQVMGTWQRYQNKDLSRDVLTCYGYGDGGGGPTEEMLEESRRMERSVAECPKTRQTFVKDFFHILEQNMDKKRLPVWNGELYLEYHRGTYTSMAKNKRYNRKCEFLNGEAEFYSVLALLVNQAAYPGTELEKNWKLLLLNQFHDILPGSAIKEVYEDSALQYEEILASDHALIDRAKKAILQTFLPEEENREKAGLLVWNSLSFKRTGLAALEEADDLGLFSQKAEDGRTLYLVSEVPSKGYRIYSKGKEEEVQKPGKVLEEEEFDQKGRPVRLQTPFYELEFNEQGEMSRIYDRKGQRELLAAGRTGNELLVFEDRPMEYDCWNIDASYEEHVWSFDQPEEFKLLENGPLRACVYIKRRFMDSVLEQKIFFYRHTARIDFQTKADWHEHQMLLKVAFPLDILCNEAVYEIQFGNVKRPTHRNTSWDQARFEVCGHKWADISEAGYGAALLNDCKYGYDIHDSVMRLTLIKSGIFPNPEADQGIHQFTYALYPHEGDFRQGDVIKEAYDLNCPLEGSLVRGVRERADSFLQIQEDNVFADTMKLAEEKDGIVLRLYEGHGKRTKVHLNLPWADQAVLMECDCMEKEEAIVDSQGGKAELLMKPYEIKTIKVKKRTGGTNHV